MLKGVEYPSPTRKAERGTIPAAAGGCVAASHSFRGDRFLIAHRGLLRLLVRRELKARYKDSTLGFVWSLIRPLSQLLIYYIAIGKFLGAERSVPSFAIFVFTGLCVWAFFSEMLTSSTSSILNNAGLVKKVYLPRELFPLASLGSALFNFAIQFAILLLAILITEPAPWVTPDIALLPLAFLLLVVFSLALGLFLAAVTVFMRDIKHLVEVAILVLFWASPMVYSYDMVAEALKGSWLEQLYLANPITIIVITFQRGLWAVGANNPEIAWPTDLLPRLLIMLAASTLLLWFSQRIFARLEGSFAQEI